MRIRRKGFPSDDAGPFRGLPTLTGMDDMDRFINEQNLQRLRKLLSSMTNEAKRKTLLGLLAAEEAKFVELRNA